MHVLFAILAISTLAQPATAPSGSETATDFKALGVQVTIPSGWTTFAFRPMENGHRNSVVFGNIESEGATVSLASLLYDKGIDRPLQHAHEATKAHKNGFEKNEWQVTEDREFHLPGGSGWLVEGVDKKNYCLVIACVVGKRELKLITLAHNESYYALKPTLIKVAASIKLLSVAGKK